MRISPRLAAPTVLAALASLVVLGACKKADETADTAAAMPAPSTEAAMTSASPMEGMKGKWNMRAVPETGDTTPTVFVLDASGDSSSWTINFPNRPPVPTRVIAVRGVRERAPQGREGDDDERVPRAGRPHQRHDDGALQDHGRRQRDAAARRRDEGALTNR